MLFLIIMLKIKKQEALFLSNIFTDIDLTDQIINKELIYHINLLNTSKEFLNLLKLDKIT